jgi:hypothetical protein
MLQCSLNVLILPAVGLRSGRDDCGFHRDFFDWCLTVVGNGGVDWLDIEVVNNVLAVIVDKVVSLSNIKINKTEQNQRH